MHLNLYFSNQYQLEGNFKSQVADLFIFFLQTSNKFNCDITRIYIYIPVSLFSTQRIVIVEVV